jgi:hypothetical protein
MGRFRSEGAIEAFKNVYVKGGGAGCALRRWLLQRARAFGCGPAPLRGRGQRGARLSGAADEQLPLHCVQPSPRPLCQHALRRLKLAPLTNP